MADDDRAGAPPVVVISTGLAERRFSGTANAVGQSILIDNVAFTVIGVTPPEFFGVDQADNTDFYVLVHTNLMLDRTISSAVMHETYMELYHYCIVMMGLLVMWSI